MKKTYWIGPLAALLVFIGVDLNFRRDFEAREHVRQEQLRVEKQNQLAAEAKARRQAIDDAVRAQAERQKELDAEQAREKADRQIRQIALDARDAAFSEQDKLSRQVDRLEQELDTEKAAVAALQQTQQIDLAEEAFLQTFVPKEQADVKAYQNVISKLAAAEAARAAAQTAPKNS